jgi:hypothetical protein
MSQIHHLTLLDASEGVDFTENTPLAGFKKIETGAM